MHQDLILLQKVFYSRLNLISSSIHLANINIADESSEYGACSFNINTSTVCFRIAKITPTKIGHFVTLWKRIGNGPTQPYSSTDSIDFFIISTKNKNNFGHFVFPKSILIKQEIVSHNNLGGKRGIRVYPPWDKPTSIIAQKTQNWQMPYFLETPINGVIDFKRALELYTSIDS